MKKILKENLFIIIILLIVCTIFLYQIQKKGFHEDEVYTIASSVNPYNGLMVAYENNEVPAEGGIPQWKTREYVQKYMTLTPDNYLNIKSIYTNQIKDNHPPLFYILTHFTTILFGGVFTKYTIFVINIIAFILSCFVIKKFLELIDKENLAIPTIIFYGLSMGTISMVLYQRMYMLLTLFILLYFYYSIKIYKDDFNLNFKTITALGIITVLGFLTQYFFAIFAGIIFIMMIIKMVKDKKYKVILKYTLAHIIYAGIGILMFPHSINHLLYSNRGISNLSNSNYIEHFITYLKELAYSFSLNDNIVIITITTLLFLAGIIYCYKKSNNKFIIVTLILPSIIFFLISVKLTSYQKLRYIMPIIPFIAIMLFIILDNLIHTKYKNIIITLIAIILVIPGIVVSKPRFLFEEYNNHIRIAEENKDKCFIYVYDNFFNHMKSVPEMMIYEKTLILNYNLNELELLTQNKELEKEESFVLCIKSYMDTEKIIEDIKSKTGFNNVETLYIGDYGDSDKFVENNLYLVRK